LCQPRIRLKPPTNYAVDPDFDRCVDGPVTAALKLKTPLASICEVSFEPAPVPIRKLFEGFSGWKSFVDEVERNANQRNLHTANAALVCYSLRCEDAPEVWDQMHFLGSCTGQNVASRIIS
jgi:hypothetical protein